jgi:four helix bundle suffix protein
MELTNVARGSLEELLLDYQDYLRHRKLPLWPKTSREASQVRALSQPVSAITDPEDAGDRARYALYEPWLENESAVIAANTLICLIHQANYLLDQQLSTLEQQFIETGGFSEQLAAARIAHRNKDRSDRSDQTDQNFPHCPQCGKLMTLRTARQGAKAGTQFWGCTGYPECKGAVPLEEK